MKRREVKPLQEFLTPLQVSEIFQVKEAAVRSWLRRRLIHGVKIGKAWRISRAAIDKFSKQD